MNSRVTGIASEPGYTVIENASLAGRNTFRVPARADMLIDVHEPQRLPTIADYAVAEKTPPLVLGGGSNILFTRDWPGVMLSLSTTGIRILENEADGALIRVEAGENWNDLVHWSLAQGFIGLENLALIPGTVGAAPIQNIGAYGVEISEFVRVVEVFDWSTGIRTHRQLRLRIRVSRFDLQTRSVALSGHGRRILSAAPEQSATRLRRRSRRTRRDARGAADRADGRRSRLSPAHSKTAQSGSHRQCRQLFQESRRRDHAARDLLARNAALPTWPASDGARKLSAAWLIEASGFKGLREGDAAVSAQHALVLVNHGKASGAQIWALAQRVREGVFQRFGVALEPEPIIV